MMMMINGGPVAVYEWSAAGGFLSSLGPSAHFEYGDLPPLEYSAQLRRVRLGAGWA